MTIVEIKEKSSWEDFLFNCEEKTFLQSWNWGEFWKKNGLSAGRQGNKIWRLGLYNKRGELFSAALVVKVRAKRGTFLLIQHGPMGEKESFNVFFEEVKKLARQEKASFIRVAPLLARTEENEKLFQDLGFKQSPMHASAYEATLKLDLSVSEEELLRHMRKTTRYLIRQAMNNPDIEITKSNRVEDVEVYDRLNKLVAKRQRFVPFSLQFIKNEFEVFAGDSQALLFFGKYKGEIAASSLIIFWSGIGFYHQAALNPKYHKNPVSYLLQWEAIKEAKKRGCKFYDFWGYVDPKSRHPWAGPTLFKMGFGGNPYFYVKTKDLPLSKKYWLTYAFEKIRKIKRGL
ncbi:MAG: peptidoglycan bridge formation glycyltransferase FemA/FemB family protein [Candidatus Nealsonbacteria bacterium]|nr:peptidoglycan bridge formation glycyltransferase FemA/FemB family protein [Candidatus Nealsonbacteria bacterium]